MMIKMTERDNEILCFINEFGFCEMPQLNEEFNFKKPRNYQVMKRLTDAGYINHERIFHNNHGIYRLTRKGAKYTGLPPLKNIPMDKYNHQLAVIEVYQKLMKQYPDSRWESERRIRQDINYKSTRKYDHVADGVLITADNKDIAIEVELTMKSKKRLNKIFWSYYNHKVFDEAWYFCTADVAEKMEKLVKSFDKIKIHSL